MTDSADYLIIGAGLAGLVVAARLSEDPNVTVTVIEAGPKLIHDENLDTPANVINNLGHPEKDWAFFSVPQKGLGDRPVFLPRGKGVGGSTLINFMELGRAAAEEYDGFEKLGATNWNWKTLLPYLKKAQSLNVTSERATELGMNFNPDFHGTDGPLTTSLPISPDPTSRIWISALKALGVKPNPDNNCGNNCGVWTNTAAVDSNAIRVSSASAYYEPNQGRPNLTVITGARVTKVLTEKTGSGITATSVEYSQDGATKVISAKKEVILSAGSYQSPQILELSGIGNGEILKKHDIPVILELDGVGSNLQEHLTCTYTAKLKPGHETWDSMQDPKIGDAQKGLYAKEKKGMFSTVPSAFAFLPLSFFEKQKPLIEAAGKFVEDKKGKVSGAVYEGYKLQHAWMSSENVPYLEVNELDRFMPGLPGVAPEPGASYISISIILVHPFNRGSVHIGSSDPLTPPAIDPGFLDNDVDASILIEGFKLARKIAETEPLKEHIEKEVSPGAELKTDDEIKDFVRQTSGTTYHPIGTLSMLPKEMGGCVDPKLKVYGTTNIRVIDASVIPIQLSAHIQETLYGLAEKAADIIKGDI